MRRAVLAVVLVLSVLPSGPVAATTDRPTRPAWGVVSSSPAPVQGIVLDDPTRLGTEVLTAVGRLLGTSVVGTTPVAGDRVAVRLGRAVPVRLVRLVGALLAGLTGARAVTADLVAEPDELPDDPYFPQQLNLAGPERPSGSPDDVSSESAGSPPVDGEGVYAIDVPRLWRATTGRPDVVVAVVDGGVVSHPDLAGRVLRGYDLVADRRTSGDGDGRDADARDPGSRSDGTYCPARPSSWHGTHVAGIVAAARNNGVGIAGVAPDVRVQPVRVVGTCGGTMSDIADGIRWAAGAPVPGVPANPTPARVVNVSLSSTVEDGRCPAVYQDAVDAARARGALVVVSAGNQGRSALTRTPGNCAGVVTVGATAPDGRPTTYTNAGRAITLMAPGGVDPQVAPDQGIWSTVDLGTAGPRRSGYARMSGTSMAAPAVAGAAALVASLGPLTADEVLGVLRRSAVRPPRKDGYYTCLSTAPDGSERTVCGAGILNLAAVPAPTPGRVVGSLRPGTEASFVPATWSGDPDRVRHEWLVDGRVLGSAETPLPVTTAMRGRSVVVRSTSTVDGYPALAGTSAPRTVPRATPQLVLRVSTTSPRRGRTVVTAVLRVAGEVRPTGRVTFRVGTRVVASGSLRAVGSRTGEVRVRLPRFRSAGRARLHATYGGDRVTAPGSARSIVLVVRR